MIATAQEFRRGSTPLLERTSRCLSGVIWLDEDLLPGDDRILRGVDGFPRSYYLEGGHRVWVVGDYGGGVDRVSSYEDQLTFDEGVDVLPLLP